MQSRVRRAAQSHKGVQDLQVNFVVVHGNEVTAHKFAPRSLYVFNESSWLRQWVIWVVTSRWFERVILLLILMNSIMLALADYSPESVDP